MLGLISHLKSVAAWCTSQGSPKRDAPSHPNEPHGLANLLAPQSSSSAPSVPAIAERRTQLLLSTGTSTHNGTESEIALLSHPNRSYATGQSCHGLVYASRFATAAGAHEALRDVRRSCWRLNADAGIGSALVAQDGLFCQWLEGPEAAVEAAFARIKRDKRHAGVTIVFRGETRRELQGWSMGLRSLFMSTKDAFERVVHIRSEIDTHAIASPMDAWALFAGLPDTLAFRPNDATAAMKSPGYLIISKRSALAAQVLSDAAKIAAAKVVVGRWGGDPHTDCDLQAAESVLNLNGQHAVVLCSSDRALLQVGVIRAKARRATHICLALRSDDPSELDSLLDALGTLHSSGPMAPRRVIVTAASWGKDSAEHARHLLKVHDQVGDVVELNLHAPNCSVHFEEAWKATG